jgi:hypothetical protein
LIFELESVRIANVVKVPVLSPFPFERSGGKPVAREGICGEAYSWGFEHVLAVNS